jgi:hypothetical protein
VLARHQRDRQTERVQACIEGRTDRQSQADRVRLTDCMRLLDPECPGHRRTCDTWLCFLVYLSAFLPVGLPACSACVEARSSSRALCANQLHESRPSRLCSEDCVSGLRVHRACAARIAFLVSALGAERTRRWLDQLEMPYSPELASSQKTDRRDSRRLSERSGSGRRLPKADGLQAGGRFQGRLSCFSCFS